MRRILHRLDHERGQVVVIIALGMVTIVAMVGVVIDGGYAWGKQRETQNGADAAAEAGAVILAYNLAGASPVRTDTDVESAVNGAGAANDIGDPVAYYTNISGDLLSPAGAVVGSEAAAAQVGNGVIPTGAFGVRAYGTQTFDTFLARIIGFNQFTATTTATAVAGWLGGTCDADSGCFVLPITVPTTLLGCDGNNQPVLDPDGTQWDPEQGVVSIPLCQNSPGNVGWLDWTPTAGGTSELEDAITDPSNPALEWPGWYYVTSTGNVNSQGVEDALNAYAALGRWVQFPQFDSTCDVDPTLSGCPDDHVGGHGSQQWYHLAGMSTFQFCSDDFPDCVAAGFTQGAYINGFNDICDTGNGGTSCITGRFLDISYKGKVQAAPGPNPATASVSVQLIR